MDLIPYSGWTNGSMEEVSDFAPRLFSIIPKRITSKKNCARRPAK
jgi:hypothetical protein